MADLRQAVAALDAHLIRRTLENDELLVRIETLTAEKTALAALRLAGNIQRSEEHTSELQTLMRISYAVFCLKKKKIAYVTQTSTCGHPTRKRIKRHPSS